MKSSTGGAWTESVLYSFGAITTDGSDPLGGLVADSFGNIFGITNLDTITSAGVVVLLAVVSMAACWAPAWRASRVDPAITLRAE